MNLSTHYRSLKKQAFIAGIICFALLAWIAYSINKQTTQANVHALKVSATPSIIRIKADSTVEITRINEHYVVNWTKNAMLPVSNTVVEALLSKLNTTCTSHFPASQVDTYWHTELEIDDIKLTLGEQNPITKQVYVKREDTAYACDELILGISRAPKARLLAKSLPFSTLMSVNGSPIDTPLTVVDVVPTRIEQIGDNVLKLFSVTGKAIDENSQTITHDFKLLASEKPNHWLWYEPTLELIYAIEKPSELGNLAFLDE